MADSYFNLINYEEGNNNSLQALKCPDGLDSGYVWFELGETHYELGNVDEVKEV